MKMERKIFEAEVKSFDDEKLIIDHFISTEKRDRGGDILKAGGMKVLGRVVVLHTHGWGPMGHEPIAKNLSLKPGEFKGKPGIIARTQFYDGTHLTPPDNTGRRLYEKTKTGVMPNWSVGWRPLKEEYQTERGGEQTRVVSEWELLEYSIVAVPMQSDAQTPPPEKAEGELQFKVVPCICDPKCEGETCRFEARGELVAWKNEDGIWEEKPYPNFHSCRLEDPDKYIRIRMENDKFGAGIHAIWGVQAGSKPVELQAIRFSLSKFTADEAKAWLKEHDYKCKEFEPATGGKAECEGCGDVKDVGTLIGVNPEEWASLMVDFSQQQTRVTNLLNEVEKLKTEIETLKSTLKGFVAPEPTPVPESKNPPALVLVRDDLAAPCAKDAIIGAIREVIGEKIQSEIDRMKGKVR